MAGYNDMAFTERIDLAAARRERRRSKSNDGITPKVAASMPINNSTVLHYDAKGFADAVAASARRKWLTPVRIFSPNKPL